MQLLKALVIGMGVLIVLAVGLLAYGLLTKTKSPSPDSVPTAAGGTAPSQAFGPLALTGNSGCRIEKATPDGHRLVIELMPAADGKPDLGCEKVIIVDMSAGAVISSVALQP